MPVRGALRCKPPNSVLCLWLDQQLWQLGEHRRKALGLIAREQLATPIVAKRLLFEINVGKGLPIGVLHNEAAIQFLD
jgi:hypothetical protein